MFKRYLKYLAYLALSSAVLQASAGSYEDFFDAIERDDAPALTALLRRGFDPNTRDAKGQVGLFLALRGGRDAAAQALLEQRTTEVDAGNLSGETPLMMAALRGRLDWCRRLVERGARIDRAGWTPLHYAASGPNPEVVAWLVNLRAPIDARSPNGTTPLMMAAGYGAEAGVAELLRAGADPKLVNAKGLRAADFARIAGREALAGSLQDATAGRPAR